jgi:multisubunit Na+/H+ antiporter MnhB subunit
MLILLAGYLGLARGKIQGWARVLGFAVLCGFAMTVKSTGVIVWPAIAYLFYAQFRDDWRQRWRLLLSSSVLIVLMCWINVVLRNFYWGPLGGGESQLRGWLIQSKFQVFTNLVGLFGSPSKGFFIFAPVLIAVLWAIPRAFRTNRDIVAFATLILVCTIGFLSILNYTTDETWGSRYLHIAVAPLLLCIGAAWPKFRWRVHLPLTALVCLGVVISFLGAFFPYGTRGAATDKAGQNTMEWLTGDNVWNEIVFDARLFQVWWHGGTDAVPWTPTHLWVWTPPKDAPTWKTVDLRELAEPQGALFYYWNKPRAPSIEKLTRFYLFSLVTGLLLLAGTVWVSVARAPGRHPLNMRLVKAAVLGVGLLVAAVAVGISMSRPKTPTLVVDKSEVVAGREAFTLKIAEMPNRKVIVRYSIDGGAPEEMGAALDAAGSVHFDVGADTRKGEYRLLAFKEQQDVFWVNSNVVIRVK